MRQTSDEAERLVDLIRITFSKSDEARHDLADLEQIRSDSKVSSDEWRHTLDYCAQALSNLSQFKSFGATKFVPRVSSAAFRQIVAASPRAGTALPLFDSLEEAMYAVEPAASLSIGFPAKGHVSAYYPGPVKPTKAEIEAVQDLCTANGVSTINTRLTKHSDEKFTLLVASVEPASSTPREIKSEKLTVEIKYGDYADCLENVNAALEKAKAHAADKNQRDMLTDYQTSFATGSVDAHKAGSAKWVKDVGPVVENYIGFIEDYVDPSGSRAEWEGFVAIVDKEESKKVGNIACPITDLVSKTLTIDLARKQFNTLVDRADQLIKDLPWGQDFEGLSLWSLRSSG